MTKTQFKTLSLRLPVEPHVKTWEETKAMIVKQHGPMSAEAVLLALCQNYLVDGGGYRK